jgi:hypothetical protein
VVGLPAQPAGLPAAVRFPADQHSVHLALHHGDVLAEQAVHQPLQPGPVHYLPLAALQQLGAAGGRAAGRGGGRAEGSQEGGGEAQMDKMA